MIKKGLDIYKKYEEIINYLIVGILTTLVSLVTKWILLFTFLDAKIPAQLQASVVLSWIAALIFAYITNRIFVFKSKNKQIMKEIITFTSARLLTLFMEMGIMWFFVTLLKLDSNLWVIIWTVVAQVVIIVLNYIFSKIFVFKTKR